MVSQELGRGDAGMGWRENNREAEFLLPQEVNSWLFERWPEESKKEKFAKPFNSKFTTDSVCWMPFGIWDWAYIFFWLLQLTYSKLHSSLQRMNDSVLNLIFLLISLILNKPTACKLIFLCCLTDTFQWGHCFTALYVPNTNPFNFEWSKPSQLRGRSKNKEMQAKMNVY